MNYIEIFSDDNVISFFLLFIRFGSLFMFVPIFSHKNIQIRMKAMMALFFTIVFYSSLPPLQIELTWR